MDFSKEAGKLLPLEKLQIKDVITVEARHNRPASAQVMAVFEKDGKSLCLFHRINQGG